MTYLLYRRYAKGAFLLCVFLWSCFKLNLREQNGDQHQETAEDLARGGESQKHDRLGKHREEGFKAHDQRADGRLGIFLSNSL